MPNRIPAYFTNLSHEGRVWWLVGVVLVLTFTFAKILTADASYRARKAEKEADQCKTQLDVVRVNEVRRLELKDSIWQARLDNCNTRNEIFVNEWVKQANREKEEAMKELRDIKNRLQ